MYHLSDLDNTLGLPRGTLASLNPDLLREATPPQGKYPVAVPRDKQEQFLVALKSVKSVRYAGTHRVKRGETIAQIAHKYGVSDKELMRINNIRSARSHQANQPLQLPVTGVAYGGSAPEPDEPDPIEKSNESIVVASAPANTSPAKTYKVKRGDTLYDIASAHKVTVQELQRWNNLGSRSQLHVGQALSIGEGKAAAPAKEALKYHTVKPGEYPGVIAQLYGVSVDELLKLNGLDKNSVIKAGDKLALAGEITASKEVADNKDDQAEAAPAPAAALRHKVAKGETPGKIAAQYGVKTQDLLSWNKLTAKSIIRVGQELTIQRAAKTASKRDSSKDVTVAKAQSSTPVLHKVTAGQNPTSIARKYGVSVNDLFKWNNWSNKHVLKIGDEVKIHRD
jgi:LysM repeat protein